MGSIRTRQDSERLMIDFRYQGVRYSQQSTLLDTAKNRHILARDMKKIEAEIELGILDIDRLFPSKSPNEPSFTCETARFDQFARLWLSEKQVEWKVAHYKQVSLIINEYLFPAFGIADIKSISKDNILKFRESLSNTHGRGSNVQLSASRINHIMSTLRQILTDAAELYEFKSVYKNIKALRLTKPTIQLERSRRNITQR